MRDLIFDTVDDLVSNFLYYDRRDDENLPRGEIEKAIAKADPTVEEIVDMFETKLREGIK